MTAADPKFDPATEYLEVPFDVVVDGQVVRSRVRRSAKDPQLRVALQDLLSRSDSSGSHNIAEALLAALLEKGVLTMADVPGQHHGKINLRRDAQALLMHAK